MLSKCPLCRIKDLHVPSPSAKNQCFGNQQRAVRYFFSQCQTIHDKVAVATLPPCPLPEEVLESLCQILEGSLPLLSRPVGLEIIEWTARIQELDKAPGADKSPMKLDKYGVQPLLVLLWRANTPLMRDTICLCARMQVVSKNN